MNEAQKAVLSLSTQKDFDPTFWIDKNPEFANSARINMAQKNKELFGVRTEPHGIHIWTTGRAIVYLFSIGRNGFCFY